MRRIQSLLFCLIGLLLAACGGPSDSMSLPTGKADLSGPVAKGELKWGESKRDSLEDELEAHVYKLRAASGAKLKLEVTRSGSSRELDSVIYLFGPQRVDGSSGPLVAKDFDSGWGKLSRVQAQLPADGIYRAVITTRDGLGSGNYRLALECESTDGCLPPTGAAQLVEEDLEKAIADAVNNIDDDISWYAARKYSYRDAAPTIEQITQAVVDDLGEFGIDDDVTFTNQGEVATSWLKAFFDDYLPEYVEFSYEDFKKHAQLGSTFKVGAIGFSYDCAPSVTCSGIFYGVLNSTDRVAYGLLVGGGDE